MKGLGREMRMGGLGFYMDRFSVGSDAIFWKNLAMNREAVPNFYFNSWIPK
jgi:hypothetical protein